jgi:hypothetical protein
LIDTDHERAALHQLAGFDPNFEDLTRGLGLDFDRRVRLDDACRLGGDHDITMDDGHGLIHHRNFLVSVASHGDQSTDADRGENSVLPH